MKAASTPWIPWFVLVLTTACAHVGGSTSSDPLDSQGSWRSGSEKWSQIRPSLRLPPVGTRIDFDSSRFVKTENANWFLLPQQGTRPLILNLDEQPPGDPSACQLNLVRTPEVVGRATLESHQEIFILMLQEGGSGGETKDLIVMDPLLCQGVGLTIEKSYNPAAILPRLSDQWPTLSPGMIHPVTGVNGQKAQDKPLRDLTVFLNRLKYDFGYFEARDFVEQALGKPEFAFEAWHWDAQTQDKTGAQPLRTYPLQTFREYHPNPLVMSVLKDGLEIGMGFKSGLVLLDPKRQQAAVLWVPDVTFGETRSIQWEGENLILSYVGPQNQLIQLRFFPRQGWRYETLGK